MLDATQQAAAIDAETSEAAQADIGSLAPTADEPLDPVALGVLHDQMNATAFAVTGGQVSEIPLPELAEAVEQVPAPTFAGIATLQGFVDLVPEGEPYRGMTDALTSNDGVGEVTAMLEGMASDKKLLAAAQRAPEQEEPTAELEPEAPVDNPEPEDRLGSLQRT